MGVPLLKTSNKFDGINLESVRAYHKSRISKTVSIAVVGMDFWGTLENGDCCFPGHWLVKCDQIMRWVYPNLGHGLLQA